MDQLLFLLVVVFVIICDPKSLILESKAYVELLKVASSHIYTIECKQCK